MYKNVDLQRDKVTTYKVGLIQRGYPLKGICTKLVPNSQTLFFVDHSPCDECVNLKSTMINWTYLQAHVSAANL